MNIDVEIVEFPETRVAAVEYRGPERQSLAATHKLIAWRRANGVAPNDGDTYGVHYSDPLTTAANDFRLDICVSYDRDVESNAQGVISKTIPGGRCARLRHYGSRSYIAEADYLCRDWLSRSGETQRDFPAFFHYLNVGPGVVEEEMVTDVYLPLL